jgi:hypothetical protein
MRYEIKNLTAVFAVAVLAAITAFCPLLVCAQPQISATAHSCCPHSHPRQAPLPCDRTSLACPYLILEKAKATLPAIALPTLHMMALAVPAEQYEWVINPPSSVRPDIDLYLRNRVLLL